MIRHAGQKLPLSKYWGTLQRTGRGIRRVVYGTY